MLQFISCRNMGGSLFPVEPAPIQRQIKITKKLLLSAMTANAIYVCKHVQCISSVNFDCTPMALPLLEESRSVVHLFCCTRFIYMTRKQQAVGFVWAPVLCGRKNNLPCCLPSGIIAKECETSTCISKQYANAHQKNSCWRHANQRHFSAPLVVAG